MKVAHLQAKAEDKRNYISQLPEDLLLKIWKHLAALPPDPLTEREQTLQNFPFRTLDNPCEPHPGLRAYPFLGQVCKQWKQILDKPQARHLIWDEIVIDFSHELITAVHTPIAWSDKRPSNEEFQKSFKEIRLSSRKIFDFIYVRRKTVKKIVLMSSEGYFSEEGEFINFVNKHDFSMIGFGMLCGILLDSLEDLTVMRCNDFFDLNTWGSEAIQSLRNLKSLRLEEVKPTGEINLISRLSNLSQLTELSLSTDSYSERWLGSEKSPSCWLGLSSLQKLTLSGHSHFWRIPTDFASLPLTHLDLSLSKVNDFSALRTVTGLQVLSLQSVLRQAESRDETSLQDSLLEELTHLTNLTALNLSENWFHCVPHQLSTLTKLEYLDLNSNEYLQVPKPLTCLYGLSKLKLVDIRYVHNEPQIPYWSAEKCETITNLSSWHKVLKRRGAHVKFLLDAT